MATATDADLEELAKLDYEMLGESCGGTVPERIAHLKAVRSNIRAAGIKPSVLKLEGTSLKGRRYRGVTK